MVKAKEYDIKMAAYFDNEMSGEEEAAFMQELNSTPALREKFEEELNMRAILGSISAKEDEQKGAPAKIIAANTKNTGTVFLKRRIIIAAAVIITVVAVSVVFIITNKTSHPLAAVPARAGSGVDSSKPASPQTAGAVGAAGLYKKFYGPYTSENDPVEVSLYYQQYKKGNYTNVLAAKNEDLQQMGANNNANVLSQYLQLYKGLTCLAQNNAVAAKKYFDTVLHTSAIKAPQYYTAQWYSAMAFLNLGLATKADSTIKVIATGASPYKTKAGQLAKLLSEK